MSDLTPQTDKVPHPDTAGAEPAAPEAQLADALAKLEEQSDAWMRALADAENARKRAQADVAAAHKFAVERMAESLLPVMDSLEAALGRRRRTRQALRDGVELTRRSSCSRRFEKAGVAEIGAATPANASIPHRHQAMAAVEADSRAQHRRGGHAEGLPPARPGPAPALVTVAKALENGGRKPHIGQ